MTGRLKVFTWDLKVPWMVATGRLNKFGYVME